MRIELVLLPLMLTGPGATDAKAHARAAWALAMARRDDPYVKARQRAIAEGRVLVVWVGCHDDRTEAVTPELLHVRVSRFPGIASTGVIVAHPSNGELWRLADLAPTEATPVRLQNLALSRVKVQPEECGR